MQELNTENYKTLQEKIKEDLNKVVAILSSWIRRLILVRWQFSTKWIYRYNIINNILRDFVVEIDILILKFM